MTAPIFSTRRCVASTLGLAVLVLVFGCTGTKPLPELGTVRGTVTLDGQPIENAVVFFTPDGRKGRAAIGMTNQKGAYSIEYAQGVPGASIGRHCVRISTSVASGSPDETVPSQYSLKDSLFADVKAGDNTIDFVLTTQP